MRFPRDPNGEYEPKFIEKYSRNVDSIEDKILGLYACGMSQRDISKQIKSLYDIEISPELLIKISEKVLPEVSEWQNRPLESIYLFVFMDTIHYKVKENHQYITKAACVVLGITLDGNKDILGVWIGENESSKLWLSVLHDLKKRGVNDVYVFCMDGLTGFRETINASFPKLQIQHCIVRQIRSSTRYVSYNIKELTSDLKLIYRVINEDEVFSELQKFEQKWKESYPFCVKSWVDNWDILSTFYTYPEAIRRIIYTTNIIEGLNRQFRKFTKGKPSFVNDASLKKMLYLASKNIVDNWTIRYRNWDMVLCQLNVMLRGRTVG